MSRLPGRAPVAYLRRAMGRQVFRSIFTATAILAAAFPVLAAGRAACCAPRAASPAHACCAAKAMIASGPAKGCCQSPGSRRPAARARAAAPAAVTAAALRIVPPAVFRVAIAGPTALLLARRAHRAPSPEETPPDLLGKTGLLLI